MALRYVGKGVLDPQASAEKYDRPRVPAKIYTDLTLNGDLTDRMSAFVGVRNAFDVAPPANPWTFLGGSTTESAGAAVYYDTIGRFFHAGVKAKF